MALIFRRFKKIKSYFGGRGYIAGEVPGILTVGGAPASRKIRVHDRVTGMLVAESKSAADGTFRIEGLKLGQRYMVIGIDHEERYNAAIMDNIEPVPM